MPKALLLAGMLGWTSAAAAVEAPQNGPSLQAYMRAYPAAALQRGVEGLAVISCVADGDGKLKDCVVADEQPAGEGFGAAALTLAPYFHLKPRTRDGRSVRGGIVRLPIRFRPPP